MKSGFKKRKKRKQSLDEEIEHKAFNDLENDPSLPNHDELVFELGGEPEETTLLIALQSEHAVRKFMDTYRLVKGTITPVISESMDKAMDSLNNYFTNVKNIEKLYDISDSTRHVKEKAASIVLNVATNEVTKLENLSELLIHSGAIHGAGVSVAAPVLSFAAAGLAWGMVAVSTVNLLRSMNAYYDSSAWFKDKVIKYKNIKKKMRKIEHDMDKLYSKLEMAGEDKITQLQRELEEKKRKLEYWIKEQEKVKREAVIIAQSEYGKGNSSFEGLKNEFITLVQNKEDEGALTASFRSQQFEAHISIEKAMNRALEGPNKILFSEMKNNQRDVIISRTVTTIGLTCAAIGATLIAVSPFCAHGAPVVLGVGVGFVALGSIIQIGKFMTVTLINAAAKNHRYEMERKKLYEKYKNDGLLDNVPDFSRIQDKNRDKLALKYRLSFENRDNKFMDEKSWYERLDAMSEKDRSRLLNKTEKKVMDENILKSVMGVSSSDYKIMLQVNDKAKKRIINRACRSTLKNTVKYKVSGFFEKKLNSKIEKPASGKDEDIIPHH